MRVIDKLGELTPEELREVHAAAAALLSIADRDPSPHRAETEGVHGRDLARFLRALYAGAGVQTDPPPVAVLRRTAPRDYALVRDAWKVWEADVDRWVLESLRGAERQSYLMRYRWRLVAVAASRAARVLRSAGAPVTLRSLARQMREARALLDAALPGYPPALAVRLAAAVSSASR